MVAFINELLQVVKLTTWTRIWYICWLNSVQSQIIYLAIAM